VAFAFAVPIATHDGLIGLDGAEFRLPVLVGPLRYAARHAVQLAIYSRLEAGDLEAALLLSTILLGASIVILLGVRVAGGIGRGSIS
jgi:ABC-type sulfate transport system permease component